MNGHAGQDGSPAEYVAHGWGLIAIPRGRKGPTHREWNQKAACVFDPAQASQLTGNIGLAHAYSGTCALDVDDFEKASTWFSQQGVDLAALFLDEQAVQVRSGQANRAKALYRLEAPLTTVQRLEDGFELRCQDRGGLTHQDLLPPSVHPSGCPYEWRGDWRNLPAIPQPLLELWHGLLRERPHGAPDHQPVIEVPPETVADLRSALNFLRSDDRDLWVRIGLALRELGETGRELWLTWSQSSEKYDALDASRRWDSFTPDAVHYATVFHEAQEAGWSNPRAKARRQSESHVEAASKEDWPDVEPLGAGYTVAAQFPIGALPDSIRLAVEEYRLYGQQPVEMIAGAALAAVSLSCQGQADVRRDGLLHGPANIALISVAESGERKSTADKAFSYGIRSWIKEQRIAAAKAIENAKADHVVWQANEKGLVRLVAELRGGRVPATMKGKGSLAEQLQAAEHDLREHRLNETRIPVEPTLFYSDATTQALVRDLGNGLPIGALWEDEAGHVVGGVAMSESNLLGFLTLISKLWEGSPIEERRTTVENRRAAGKRFTVNLMMQPTVMTRLLGDQNGLSRGTGFMARILIAQPTSTMGTRMYREPGRMLRLEGFNDRCYELLDLPLQIADGTVNELDPPRLRLSPEAKAAWVEYHDTVERELRPYGELETVRDFASKSADNAARLAGLFHIFDGRTTAEPIDEHTINSGIELAAWYLQESLRLIGAYRTPEHVLNALELFRWMVASEKQTHTTSDLAKFGPYCIRPKDPRDRALGVLEKHGYLLVERSGKRRSYRINPNAVEQRSELP